MQTDSENDDSVSVAKLRLELEKNVMTIKDMVADGIARSESLASETFEKLKAFRRLVLHANQQLQASNLPWWR